MTSSREHRLWPSAPGTSPERTSARWSQGARRPSRRTHQSRRGRGRRDPPRRALPHEQPRILPRPYHPRQRHRRDGGRAEEIFGPVLSLSRASTLDDAIAQANRSSLGNMSVIFTSSGRASREFRERVHAGMVGVSVAVAQPFAFSLSQAGKDRSTATSMCMEPMAPNSSPARRSS